MATMINCAIDWTYDLFVEDAKLYSAKPIKGVHCRSNASDRERFMTWLKDLVRDFKQGWFEVHGEGKMYAPFAGYIGDAFGVKMMDANFSDYYKDVYGQRPHLHIWFYINQLGLPTGQDTIRMFCNDPVAEAIKNAKANRLEVFYNG